MLSEIRMGMSITMAYGAPGSGKDSAFGLVSKLWNVDDRASLLVPFSASSFGRLEKHEPTQRRRFANS